jgi:hypothetical protein
MIQNLRSRRHGIAVVFLAGALLSAAACSSGSSASPDSGAKGGTGGSATGGTGGKVDAAAGGAGGFASGGTTGTGGAGGTAVVCLLAPTVHTSTFTTNFDGWNVGNNGSVELVPSMADGGGGTVASLDTTDGSPANGSAKLQIPFQARGEQFLFAQNYAPSLNLTGGTVTAMIKLDSGLYGSIDAVAHAFIVLKTTGAYNYATGPSINLDQGAGWVQLTFNVNAPAQLPDGYNPCDVREIDVEIDTTTASGTYVPAVIHIDTIAITGAPTTDGGASDAAATDASGDATADGG